MAADMTLLEPDFGAKIETVLDNCLQRGCTLIPFFTLRDPWAQAKLWRQSRSTASIRRMLQVLSDADALFLAEVLESVGPQNGRWATNCLPGQSWHQHGHAVDCFVAEKGGRSVWAPSHPAYEAYAQEAKAQGLVSGLYWSKRDAVHVQATAGRVRDQYGWPEIDRMMRDRFEGERS